MNEVLDVENLSLSYGPLQAVRRVSLRARAGEVVGIVGESGCGKSSLASALIGLPPEGARLSGAVRVSGADLITMPDQARRQLRGDKIAMIFQDPMSAFNPVLTLGAQLIDFQHRSTLSRRARRARAEAMLARVGLPDPGLAMQRCLHELSGGMRQRAAIAAALLVNPELLIADEPTTALDVTMEAQIIHLLRGLRDEYHGAIVVITHHLGVVGELCDRVYVLYAGEVVEEGTADEIYHTPRHPYTAALIACDPAHLAAGSVTRLPVIAGRLPDMSRPPQGCAFAPRCARAEERCQSLPPPRVTISETQAALCHRVTP